MGGLDIPCTLVFVHVRSVLEMALFLSVVCCVVSLMFAGVAVQRFLVQQCLRNEGKQESDDHWK